MNDQLNRRQWLAAGAVGASALATAGFPTKAAAEGATPALRGPFRYCLNTATIMGQKLSILAQIKIAADAGYDAIEPWVRDLEAYLKAGGTTAEIRRALADGGLTVESAIGFAKWIVDDPAERKKGLEHAKRDMNLLAEIGGRRIAAPPIGTTEQEDLNLLAAAERYAALLELGDTTGVVPQIEVWGFSKSVRRLGEALLIATESGHPKACLLPDIYHMHRGGGDFDSLRLVAGSAIHVFHVNDYPAGPHDKLTDADRVYPGDGIAPMAKIFDILRTNGFRGYLSLELFNRDYWQQDAAVVATTGLAKMKALVEK